jgi:WD40 repeat protein
VAKLVGLPPATVGGYFSGRHLPAVRPPDLLETILRACGVDDPGTIEEWTRTLARVRRAPGPRPSGAPVPYRGLASFDVDDAEWFFGREGLTDRLVKAMVDRWWEGGIVVVVGPSGAGKSSLIHAGAIAAVRSGAVSPPGGDGWRLVRLTPGAHPLATLRTFELAPRTVIVVDQFEQLFTACDDEVERRGFVDALSTSGAVVVIGLRADFYHHALRLPGLAPALQDSQVVVGPMSETELRRAIVEPARRANLDVEEGLVELLLRDYAGGLPLLSYALRATWERGRHGRLTVADYQATGGVRGAVARTAEDVYAKLTLTQQELARRMFLRLVHVTPGTVETRRPVAQDELARGGDVRAVLERFIEARLVTADRDQLQIAHEALLTAWPRLRSWIDADRTGLRMHRQITEAAQVWQESGRDPHTLLRGGRLAATEEWHSDERLNDLEREFLAASIEYEQAARRRTKRIRQLVAALTALVLVSMGSLSILAFHQRAVANVERDLAVSRQVATVADQLRETDPALAMQLALAAYRTAPTPEARSSLLGAYVTPPVTRVLGSAGVAQAVAVNRDRTAMAAAGADKAIRLWRLGVAATRGPVLHGHTDTIFALAFSPDGTVLASGSGDRTVRLWRVADWAPLGTLTDATHTVYSLAFSPDGQTLAAGSADKTVRLWRVSDWTPIGPSLAFDGFVQSVAFSPDGTVLAAGSADKTVRLWRVGDWTPLGAPLTGPTKTVFSVAFSPDGQTLAAGSADKTVWRWSLADPARPAVIGTPLAVANGWVNAVAFDPAGQSLAAASSDGHIWLWNTTTWLVTSSLPHPAPVTNLAYLGDSRTLVSSAADGTARLWRPPGPVLGGPSETVFNALFAATTLLVTSGDSTASLWDTADPRQPRPLGPTIANVNVTGRSSGAAAISPDRRSIAVGGVDGKIRLWDVRDPARPEVFATELTAHTSTIQSLTYSPDGRLLAAGSDDRTTSLWDVTDPGRPALRGTPLTGPTNYVYQPAFRPDGRVLAVGSADNHVYLWDIADPGRPVALGPALTGPASYVYSVAFSPDGRTLAAGSADNTVRLWDVTDPRTPVPLGTPLTGPDNYVFSVAFSPGGRTLAAGAGNGTIWLWDVTDRHRPTAQATLTGHTAAVFTVAFDPHRPVLASGGADKVARLWLLDPEAVATQVCATTGDPITPAEWRKYVPGRPYHNPCR